MVDIPERSFLKENGGGVDLRGGEGLGEERMAKCGWDVIYERILTKKDIWNLGRRLSRYNAC